MSAQDNLQAAVGDPNDPQGMVAMMEQFFEWMQVKNYSERTIEVRRSYIRYFIDWCAARGISQPTEVTKPIIERYQRYLFHFRKRNGDPLSFRSQHARLVRAAGMVQVAGSPEPHPLQPRQPTSTFPSWSTACQVRPVGQRSGAGHQPGQRHAAGWASATGPSWRPSTRPASGAWKWSACSPTTSTRAGHGRCPAGQRQEGPDDPHWRPGRWHGSNSI